VKRYPSLCPLVSRLGLVHVSLPLALSLPPNAPFSQYPSVSPFLDVSLVLALQHATLFLPTPPLSEQRSASPVPSLLDTYVPLHIETHLRSRNRNVYRYTHFASFHDPRHHL
jgi:hypothetical protein